MNRPKKPFVPLHQDSETDDESGLSSPTYHYRHEFAEDEGGPEQDEGYIVEQDEGYIAEAEDEDGEEPDKQEAPEDDQPSTCSEKLDQVLAQLRAAASAPSSSSLVIDRILILLTQVGEAAGERSLHPRAIDQVLAQLKEGVSEVTRHRLIIKPDDAAIRSDQAETGLGLQREPGPASETIADPSAHGNDNDIIMEDAMDEEEEL
ncbi:MAG: hypothetical protein M1816_002405 [Peltula sp. TS41687]|nr:MAG: hypothetical protein M1816_002405 [Peltula sp. TS41687]